MGDQVFSVLRDLWGKSMIINDLLSARYELGGRGPNSYDCLGLFMELCKRRGVDIKADSPKKEADRQTAIFEESERNWLKLDQPESGCAVAIRIGPWVSHLGMVMDDVNYFIHADEGTGVSVERLDTMRWSKRIAGFYKYVS